MEESSTHKEIERLEARIEALADSIEQYRKIGSASKLTIAIGAAWLALMLLGVIPFTPAGFVIAAAATIGGIVLFGSNSATWKRTEAERQQAETLRTELIEQLEMRVVGERRLLH